MSHLGSIQYKFLILPIVTLGPIGLSIILRWGALKQGSRARRSDGVKKNDPKSPEGLMGIVQIPDPAQPVIKVTHPSIQTPALVKPGRGWISVLDIGNESSL